MNLRRMNASERMRLYGKFGVSLTMLILICFYSFTAATYTTKKGYKIPIENRTCEDIYNLSIHGKLFSNNKSSLYKPETILIYYMENCQCNAKYVNNS